MHIDGEIQRERKWRNMERGKNQGKWRGGKKEEGREKRERGEIFEAGSGDRFKLIKIE
jgi:hypothetical protein